MVTYELPITAENTAVFYRGNFTEERYGIFRHLTVQDAHKQPTSIRMPAWCVVNNVLDKKKCGLCIVFLIIEQLNYCILVGLNTPVEAVSYEEIFPRNFGVGGVKKFPWRISSGAQSEDLGPSLTIQEFFSKKIYLILYAPYFVVREEGMGWGGKTLIEE